MTKREFLKEHRKDIDKVIRRGLGSFGYDKSINNDEREMWIMNDENLYNLSRSCGVRI